MRTLLAFDIETVPINLMDTYPRGIIEYLEKKISQGQERNPEFDYNYFASIDGDFGKIICISLATYDSTGEKIKLKSFFGLNEKQILEDFIDLLNKPFQYLFLHYNGLNFDVPFIIKRCAYHQLKLDHNAFKNLVKFRNDPHFDLMQEWAKYDITRTKPLSILAYLHHIPSPKEDLNGADVYQAFLAGEWDRIKRYCEYDSATVLNLYRKIYESKDALKIENYLFS